MKDTTAKLISDVDKIFKTRTKTMTYYALYDLQVHRYLASGRNSTSLAELKDAFIDYISIDFESDEDEKHYRKLKMATLAELWDFDIEKQKEKFDESDY